MIKVEIKTKLNFPKFDTLQEDLSFIAERILIPDMQKGIHAGAAINGGRLPQNEPETIKRKSSSRPLIETGTLLASFMARKRGKTQVMITLGSERKDIGGHLQIRGVKSKRGLKFYRFFGISRDGKDQAMNYMKRRIKEAINAG